MPLYVSDYLRDTRRLTAAEHGAYLLLIMEYWTSGGLPDDDRQLSRIACMTPAEWRRAKPTIQAFFRDGWRHQRIEDEIAKAIEKHERRSEAGKRGGIAKANAKRKPSNATSNALASSSQPQPHTEAVVDKQQQLDPPAAAGKSMLQQEDFDLSDRVMEAMGLHKHDTQCVGTAYFCKKWIDAGWQPDLIVDTVKRIMARRSKPPGNVKYFEQAIADAHAEMARPLPAGSARSTGPPRRETFADLAMEFERRSTLDEHTPDDFDGITIDG